MGWLIIMSKYSGMLDKYQIKSIVPLKIQTLQKLFTDKSHHMSFYQRAKKQNE